MWDGDYTVSSDSARRVASRPLAPPFASHHHVAQTYLGGSVASDTSLGRSMLCGERIMLVLALHDSTTSLLEALLAKTPVARCTTVICVMRPFLDFPKPRPLPAKECASGYRKENDLRGRSARLDG